MIMWIKMKLKQHKCYHHEPGGDKLINSYHQSEQLYYTCASCKKVWLI